MSIGANTSVITAGAVLTFATRFHLDGVNVSAVGMVLMLVGLAGLILQITALRRQRELTALQASAPNAVLVRPGPRDYYSGTTADPLPPGAELTAEQIQDYYETFEFDAAVRQVKR